MKSLASVFIRMLLVSVIAIPALLVLIVMSAFGPGSTEGLFVILIALALGGMAWAFLPLIHAGPKSGLFFVALWLGLAVSHLVWTGSGTEGGVAVAWLLATLFLGINLKSRPPAYIPRDWRDSAAAGKSSNDA